MILLPKCLEYSTNRSNIFCTAQGLITHLRRKVENWAIRSLRKGKRAGILRKLSSISILRILGQLTEATHSATQKTTTSKVSQTKQSSWTNPSTSANSRAPETQTAKWWTKVRTRSLNNPSKARSKAHLTPNSSLLVHERSVWALLPSQEKSNNIKSKGASIRLLTRGPMNTKLREAFWSRWITRLLRRNMMSIWRSLRLKGHLSLFIGSRRSLCQIKKST